MKKGFILGVATGIIFTGMSVALANSQIQAILNSQIKISVNGELKTFTDEKTNEIQYPITYNNRTYLPLRTVANLTDVSVDYDGDTNTAILESQTKYSFREGRTPYKSYDEVIAKYIETARLDSDVYSSDLADLFLYEDLMSLDFHDLYYAKLDINKDGRDELIIYDNHLAQKGKEGQNVVAIYGIKQNRVYAYAIAGLYNNICLRDLSPNISEDDFFYDSVKDMKDFKLIESVKQDGVGMYEHYIYTLNRRYNNLDLVFSEKLNDNCNIISNYIIDLDEKSCPYTSIPNGTKIDFAKN